ncbi:MAG: PhoH family protein [Halomonas sp.]|nr:PhoH family protein [Halomonas sp.]MDN6298084.1 PhoH family protein [Halomonas sp.]MDN6315395.1 PhoH family protein [Halomonas sp.]MDN6336691.1 PhoH family protein [Halomonas sp.]
MVRLEKKATRLYVLDTNVLIHDPMALYHFDEHDVVIPMTVLEELDKHKNGIRDIARTARQVSRTLSDLTHRASFADIERGIPLPRATGEPGRLRFLCYDDLKPLDRLFSSADNRLLAETCRLRDERPDASVILVSKDINLRIKAAALNVPVEDYLSDRAFDDSDSMIEGAAVYSRDPHAAPLWETLDVQVNVERVEQRTFYQLKGDIPKEWHSGMLVSDSENGAEFEAIVRDISPSTARLELLTNYRHHGGVWGVHAHDSRQNFTLNLLMDKDIDLVTIAGNAGTGKTFMTLAAAFQQTLDHRDFERIVFTRAPIAMGEDIGFLPGTEEEKMSPWMGAFHDNMDNLLRSEEGESSWDDSATRQLIGSRVQIRSPTFMRGRTLNDTLLIIDEAQNFTPKQLKGLISRAGKNTKIVCLGNVGQIDTPYLTANTCGMAAVVERFRDWPHAGHITLKSVERSRLALAAEELL